jgi:hypothetical protein
VFGLCCFRWWSCRKEDGEKQKKDEKEKKNYFLLSDATWQETKLFFQVRAKAHMSDEEFFLLYRGPSNLLLAALDSAEEGESDVFAEALNIKVINDVIDEFSRQHDVSSFLAKAVQFIGGVDIAYTYAGLRYSGAVKNKRQMVDGTVTDKIAIRISSDGFRYPLPNQRDCVAFVIARGKRGWAVMNEAYLAANVPAVVAVSKATGLAVKFLYNARLNRIDIHFVDPATYQPRMLIALEAGNPDSIDKDEYFAFFGLKRESHV